MRAQYQTEEEVDWDEVFTIQEAAKVLDCHVDRVRTTLGESGRAIPLDVIKRRKVASLWWRDRVIEAARTRGRLCVICDENVVGTKGGKVCRSPRCGQAFREQKFGTSEMERRERENPAVIGDLDVIVVNGKAHVAATGTTLSRASTRAEVFAAIKRQPGEGLTMDRVLAVSMLTGLPPAQVLSISRSYGRGVL